MKVHLFKESFTESRKGVTACGKQVFRARHTNTEAETTLGARLEITMDKSKVTCKNCHPAKADV